MGDPLDTLKGGAYIYAQAEIEAKERQEKVQKINRHQLMNRGDVLRVINSDDVIKMIRAYIQSQHDDCMSRLFDPQMLDINSITMLKGEIQAHKKYLGLFEAWEKLGKQALKKLLNEKNGNSQE